MCIFGTIKFELSYKWKQQSLAPTFDPPSFIFFTLVRHCITNNSKHTLYFSYDDQTMPGNSCLLNVMLHNICSQHIRLHVCVRVVMLNGRRLIFLFFILSTGNQFRITKNCGVLLTEQCSGRN